MTILIVFLEKMTILIVYVYPVNTYSYI